MSRPLRGPGAMQRRTIHLPQELWEQVESYAVDLAQRDGKVVTVAEAIRRVLEQKMKRWNQ